jgi:HD-like signal output (HDOD) protein
MEQHDLPALADVVLRVADVCEELAVPYDAIGGAIAARCVGHG